MLKSRGFDLQLNKSIIMNGQDLISCMRSSSGHIKKAPTENNENFTKKCGISKIICDTTCRGV